MEGRGKFCRKRGGARGWRALRHWAFTMFERAQSLDVIETNPFVEHQTFTMLRWAQSVEAFGQSAGWEQCWSESVLENVLCETVGDSISDRGVHHVKNSI